jgi:hypothetical protein
MAWITMAISVGITFVVDYETQIWKIWKLQIAIMSRSKSQLTRKQQF